jgi:L-alanine-DL-glutamate epimerase-like enolase superfamily enzyme
MPPASYRVTGLRVYLLPVQTRVPLKFGTETLTSATVLRVAMQLSNGAGHSAEGWGETPLSVQWVWPSQTPYGVRHQTLISFALELARVWGGLTVHGHALEAGHDFLVESLPKIFNEFNRALTATENKGAHPGKVDLMPWLAALVCYSAFDLALHDAFGKLLSRPVYETYTAEFFSRDLSHFLEAADGYPVSFRGRYPGDYLVKKPPQQLIAWHLVGGLDPLEAHELSGSEPRDGYPVLLPDWIDRDGLKCLKVKLRGNDPAWDLQRIIRVGQLALPRGVEWLTADFNCTVQDPQYVNEILDALKRQFPAIHECLLYVEQPFPYDLEANQIDVHSVSARKPLFLDESAHDWRMIRLGRELGWTGVALKTCKTQTGAILSACWARAHGMELMVQDLTNPMLAQISHLLLAAHVGTIMGVETNSMQFYPEASLPEADIHPNLYQRRRGVVDLASIHGPGFGYRTEEIRRALPAPVFVF